MRRFQDVIREIEAEIRDGHLRPGDRLAPERELAGRFGVSRTCVREALRTLAEKGLVESRQGAGTYVRDGAPLGLSRAFAAALAERRARILEVFELRRAVEPGIAALAAQKATPRDLDRLKAVVFDQQQALAAGHFESDLDAAFHLALAEATHNKVVVELMAALAETMGESRPEFLQGRRRAEASFATHLALLQAIATRNPEAARQAMLAHLDQVAAVSLNPNPGPETD